MRLSVMVTGPPSWICFLKRGTTEPLEPSTLPNRTAQNSVGLSVLLCRIISQKRLVAPMKLVGFTALSVEIMTNFLTPNFSAARTT